MGDRDDEVKTPCSDDEWGKILTSLETSINSAASKHALNKTAFANTSAQVATLQAEKKALEAQVQQLETQLRAAGTIPEDQELAPKGTAAKLERTQTDLGSARTDLRTAQTNLDKANSNVDALIAAIKQVAPDAEALEITLGIPMENIVNHYARAAILKLTEQHDAKVTRLNNAHAAALRDVSTNYTDLSNDNTALRTVFEAARRVVPGIVIQERDTTSAQCDALAAALGRVGTAIMGIYDKCSVTHTTYINSSAVAASTTPGVLGRIQTWCGEVDTKLQANQQELDNINRAVAAVQDKIIGDYPGTLTTAQKIVKMAANHTDVVAANVASATRTENARWTGEGGLQSQWTAAKTQLQTELDEATQKVGRLQEQLAKEHACWTAKLEALSKLGTSEKIDQIVADVFSAPATTAVADAGNGAGGP
jgi:chromosome segregation ATPase